MGTTQFAADPVNALRQARRVAKPGASIAITIWGEPKENEVTRYMAALSALMLPAPTTSLLEIGNVYLL